MNRIEPYSGHLERGPDRIYKGPAIRLDLAGYGGAVELGYEGTTMAERPDDYAAFIVLACNSYAADQAKIKALSDALTTLMDSEELGGVGRLVAKAKVNAALAQ